MYKVFTVVKVQVEQKKIENFIAAKKSQLPRLPWPRSKLSWKKNELTFMTQNFNHTKK